MGVTLSSSGATPCYIKIHKAAAKTSAVPQSCQVLAVVSRLANPPGWHSFILPSLRSLLGSKFSPQFLIHGNFSSPISSFTKNPKDFSRFGCFEEKDSFCQFCCVDFSWWKTKVALISVTWAGAGTKTERIHEKWLLFMTARGQNYSLLFPENQRRIGWSDTWLLCNIAADRRNTVSVFKGAVPRFKAPAPWQNIAHYTFSRVEVMSKLTEHTYMAKCVMHQCHSS